MVIIIMGSHITWSVKLLDEGRAVCGTKELFSLCHFKTLSVGLATLDLPLCTPPLYCLSINRVRVIKLILLRHRIDHRQLNQFIKVLF